MDNSDPDKQTEKRDQRMDAPEIQQHQVQYKTHLQR